MENLKNTKKKINSFSDCSEWLHMVNSIGCFWEICHHCLSLSRSRNIFIIYYMLMDGWRRKEKRKKNLCTKYDAWCMKKATIVLFDQSPKKGLTFLGTRFDCCQPSSLCQLSSSVIRSSALHFLTFECDSSLHHFVSSIIGGASSKLNPSWLYFEVWVIFKMCNLLWNIFYLIFRNFPNKLNRECQIATFRSGISPKPSSLF